MERDGEVDDRSEETKEAAPFGRRRPHAPWTLWMVARVPSDAEILGIKDLYKVLKVNALLAGWLAWDLTSWKLALV